MAFSLPLPDPLPAQRWNEPPHVTILHKKRAWRFDLRSGTFLDAEPDPKDVFGEIVKNTALLRKKWDEMYPENPVESKEDGDE